MQKAQSYFLQSLFLHKPVVHGESSALSDQILLNDPVQHKPLLFADDTMFSKTYRPANGFASLLHLQSRFLFDII